MEADGEAQAQEVAEELVDGVHCVNPISTAIRKDDGSLEEGQTHIPEPPQLVPKPVRVIGTIYAMMGLDCQQKYFVHCWEGIRAWNERNIVADFNAHQPEAEWRLKYPISGWRYNSQQREDAYEQAEGEWLCFIDTDMVFSEDVVGRLIMSMQTIVRETGKCDAITGLYTNREPSCLPLVYRYMESPDAWVNVLEFPWDRPFRVDGSGAGCLLIRKSLLDVVKQKFGTCFGELGPNYKTEDLCFCLRAWKMGAHWWCDPSIQAGHARMSWAWPQDFKERQAQAIEEAEKNGVLYAAYPPATWLPLSIAVKLTQRDPEAIAAAIANRRLTAKHIDGQEDQVELETLVKWHTDGGT